MQSKKESFLAFFSYVQANDEHDRGKLTLLRKSLQTEIWAQTGKSYKIFQDTENIKWGSDWKERIKDALEESFKPSRLKWVPPSKPSSLQIIKTIVKISSISSSIEETNAAIVLWSGILLHASAINVVIF